VPLIWMPALLIAIDSWLRCCLVLAVMIIRCWVAFYLLIVDTFIVDALLLLLGIDTLLISCCCSVWLPCIPLRYVDVVLLRCVVMIVNCCWCCCWWLLLLLYSLRSDDVTCCCCCDVRYYVGSYLVVAFRVVALIPSVTGITVVLVEKWTLLLFFVYSSLLMLPELRWLLMCRSPDCDAFTWCAVVIAFILYYGDLLLRFCS
jgi:hypothetical protein